MGDFESHTICYKLHHGSFENATVFLRVTYATTVLFCYFFGIKSSYFDSLIG